jgi:hypothetical protein
LLKTAPTLEERTGANLAPKGPTSAALKLMLYGARS